MHKQILPAASEQSLEKIGHWFRALAGDEPSQLWCCLNNVPLTKAGAEYPDTAGGFIVPDSFDDLVINVRETVGAFRRGCEVRPVTSDSQIRPRRTGTITANWVSEGASIPESGFTLDALQVSMSKVGILVRASSELFDDSAVSLASFLTGEFGYALAGLEDDAGFFGTGTSDYRGIQGLTMRLAGNKSSVAGASGHNTYSTLDGTDLANLISSVMASALPNAAWYCSSMAYALTFCRLAGASGGLVATQNANGTVNASYLGYPIRFSSKMADVSTTLAGLPMLFFGDLAASSLLAERRKLVVAMSRQHALDTDQVLIRCTQRMMISNHDTGSATVKAPIAVLLGGA